MMVYILLGVVGVCVVVFAVLATSRRTPSSDDSVADFQRHLSALSPEARRHLVETPDIEVEPRQDNHGRETFQNEIEDVDDGA